MIKRTIKEQIVKSLKNKPVTLITGSRQIGKSTICYEIKKELNYNYVSLDDIRRSVDDINKRISSGIYSRVVVDILDKDNDEELELQ